MKSDGELRGIVFITPPLPRDKQSPRHPQEFKIVDLTGREPDAAVRMLDLTLVGWKQLATRVGQAN